ncbi:molybdate ABC transporter substrate-binding protein [Chryseobacterium sp. SL1]|uniref:molybdate ABC transporter substrate-binding protein n=1 Tax=Chryseobacterium sp. SL1 TaxID=2995159 RepID=UPI0022723A3A|nr:molybdate ABC transporter substrate-binding protein [Chryseobacterium sp. SL1]MCY1661009.1 molybdate ABC transporter substrate-binding protein [Chryseobacterium sp. SL1]
MLLFFGCKKESGHQKNSTQNSFVSVAAAANLRDVLKDLKQLYIAENPGKKVEITFGSSGLLAQQIINGAAFDLFLSADSSFAEKLKNENRNFGNAEVYALGRVAMWSSAFDLSKGLQTVLNPEIKKIAVADPKLAPYGKNAVQALKNSGVYEKIEHKIVWAENISQAAQFAVTGNADLAFIAFSNTVNKEMKAKGNFYQLSEKEAGAIPQSGIILKGKKQAEARLFFDFIRSKKAAQVWKKYGYQTEIQH